MEPCAQESAFLLDRPGDVRWVAGLGGGSLYDVGSYPVNFIGMVIDETTQSPPGKGPRAESISVQCVKKDGVDELFSAPVPIVFPFHAATLPTNAEAAEEGRMRYHGEHGQEMDVLTGIDFGAARISVLSIENNYGNPAIDAFMKSARYTLVHEMGEPGVAFDRIFVAELAK